MEPYSLTVYYDGLCHLCSREISHYRLQKGSENIYFVDIAKPGFDAAREGLDPYRVNKEMHVRLANGRVEIGVAAFSAIWDLLPKYRWLGRFSREKVPNRFLRVGYRVFSEVRPFLPRKKGDCEDSPYCDQESRSPQ